MFIQKQIESHKTAISDLLTRLNTLSNTACLPTELYYEIFLYYLAILRGTPEEPFALLSIMHTCSQWRRIATGLPFLWRRIVITPSRDLTNAALKYSKQCPLIIEVKAFKIYKRIVASLKVALAQMKRVESLHLALPPAAYESISKSLTMPAPMLREVHLDATHTMLSREVAPFSWGKEMKNLQEIYTALPLSTIRSVIQPSVRSLYLDLVHFGWAHPFGLAKDILSFLPNMRSLERLFINTQQAELTSTSKTIPLPRLKFLEVHSPEDFVTRLLSSLQLPTHTLLRLICRSHSPFQTSRSPYAMVFASHAATYPLPYEYDRLLLDLYNASKASNPKQPDHHSAYWAAQSSRPRNFERLEISISSNVLEPRRLCDKLALSTVQVLWLNMVQKLPANASVNPFGSLKSVFREMRDVRTLILEDWPETCVAEALSTSVDSIRELPGNNPRLNDVLFPILETLVLKHPLFGEGLGSGPDNFYRDLVKGLEDRGGHLKPIKSLIIEDPADLKRDHLYNLLIQTWGVTDVMCPGYDEVYSFPYLTTWIMEGLSALDPSVAS